MSTGNLIIDQKIYWKPKHALVNKSLHVFIQVVLTSYGHFDYKMQFVGTTSFSPNALHILFILQCTFLVYYVYVNILYLKHMPIFFSTAYSNHSASLLRNRPSFISYF